MTSDVFLTITRPVSTRAPPTTAAAPKEAIPTLPMARMASSHSGDNFSIVKLSFSNRLATISIPRLDTSFSVCTALRVPSLADLEARFAASDQHSATIASRSMNNGCASGWTAFLTLAPAFSTLFNIAGSEYWIPDSITFAPDAIKIETISPVLATCATRSCSLLI